MALKVDEYTVVLTLTEPMLGTVPKNKDVYTEYIASKLVDRKGEEKAAAETGSDQGTVSLDIVDAADEEVATVLPDSQKGYTGFHTDDGGKAFIYDYQVKGFLKEAGNALKDLLGDARVTALKSKIDSYVFVYPRRIYLNAKLEEPLERPLRAMTMQGPRVTLVKSDVCPAGTSLTVTLKVFPHKDLKEDTLTSLLDYGQFLGLGQWRTGSYGRFTYELSKAQA